MTILTKLLTAALVTCTVILAAVLYLYATARGDLQTEREKLTTALSANVTLTLALDKMTKQREIDDRRLVELTQSIRQLDQAFDDQTKAFNELNNDPEASDYLKRTTPDSVRKLFNK